MNDIESRLADAMEDLKEALENGAPSSVLREIADSHGLKVEALSTRVEKNGGMERLKRVYGCRAVVKHLLEPYLSSRAWWKRESFSAWASKEHGLVLTSQQIAFAETELASLRARKQRRVHLRSLMELSRRDEIGDA